MVRPLLNMSTEVAFMIGIRQKLMLGFVGLIVIVAGIGLLTMDMVSQLGDSIDVILRENYRSVIACQDMIESLDRINAGLLYSLLGDTKESRSLVDPNVDRFLAGLHAELGNITLPTEGEKTDKIRNDFEVYRRVIPLVMSASLPLERRNQAYFSSSYPQFKAIKSTARSILIMNQKNMQQANQKTRAEALSAYYRVLFSIIACALLAILFGFLIRRWIMRPIQELTASAREIQNGNLDLVVRADSRDEFGQLADSFNAMAEGLRRIRRSERIELVRTRKAIEEVFKSLPTAIAVLDLEGRVEVATRGAEQMFHLVPGTLIDGLAFDWLLELIENALAGNRATERDRKGSMIQHFVNGREYFFKPMVLPICSDDNEQTGVIVILHDVTQIHEQQELKRTAVSTVSHQLRTPLTSLRMSIHLLLEGTVGNLNEKQVELLVAARDESERLVNILDEFLDMSRIESGRSLMEIYPIEPHVLVRKAVEKFLPEAKDRGIDLESKVSEDLSEVSADSSRILHVFDNLLSNALRHTPPGGNIVVEADQRGKSVFFRVHDNGEGIAAGFLKRLFEPFFRVPGKEDWHGVGLGLAIAREIVVAHGGEIGVVSELGKGSTFWFNLQVVEENRSSSE